VKQYISDQSGTKVVEGIDIEKSQKIHKTITQYGGDADLKWLHGCRLWVDKEGIVIRGPEPMIGRRFEDLENLTYADVFTVERSVMRALSMKTKSYNPDDPNEAIAIKKMMIMINDNLDKAIGRAKTQKATMFIKDPLYQGDK